MEGFREGAEKKAKQFRPKNPSRLTVAELEEFLALSEEEEDLDGSDGCDISDMMDCDISDEDDSWLLRDSTPPLPALCMHHPPTCFLSPPHQQESLSLPLLANMC